MRHPTRTGRLNGSAISVREPLGSGEGDGKRIDLIDHKRGDALTIFCISYSELHKFGEANAIQLSRSLDVQQERLNLPAHRFGLHR